ncbi:hypothetical protein [Epibacterium ulvae]|uniref:hypothetical protein n=1 Tax=Epibacterium ulvae TaxID=1156985 RepID=UPI0024910E1E|nr:hypothetical protein [Epibacterium ulvae]
MKELGLNLGQRSIIRIMLENGIQVLRSRKFKRTAYSDHRFNIASNRLNQDFTATVPSQNGPVT